MTGLLKLEPKSGSRLYIDIDDERVDADTEIFKWDWIKKATKIKNLSSLMDHLERGHFGPWEKIGKNYRLLEGHRAICRYNNDRYINNRTIVVTKEQYDDMMNGRPVQDVMIMVRGKPQSSSVSIKKFDKADFIAVRRYSNDQAQAMAVGRVENDIADGRVQWYDLPRESEEFREHFKKRVQMIEDLYMSEMILMARDLASPADMRSAADLPASILNLINHKLTATQAEYYISRFVAAMDMIPNLRDNPFVAFRVHQIILEEMQVEHYRDLQRICGDEVDSKIQGALQSAMVRLNRLMISGLMKIGLSDNGALAVETVPELESTRPDRDATTEDPYA